MDTTMLVYSLAVCVFLFLIIPQKVTAISVTIAKTEQSPGEVEVKDNVKELRVTDGDDIGLRCTVKGVESDFSWAIWSSEESALTYKTQLLASEKARYRIEESRARNGDFEYTLTIQNVRLKDEGNYSCQYTDGLNDKIQLLVTTRPNITMITGLQTAQVGDNVLLQCLTSGSPLPVVVWRHARPNHMLPNDLMGSYKQSHILDIRSIELKDRGEYECIASNGVQMGDLNARRTSFIRMHYAPTVEPLLDDFTVVKAKADSEVSLICKSMAYPRSFSSDVQWFLEDEESGSVRELFNGNDGYKWSVSHQLSTEEVDPYEETTFSILEISKMNNNTVGVYRCQFMNPKGFTHAQITVELAPKEGGAYHSYHSSGSFTTSSFSTALITLLITAKFIWS